MWQALGLPGLVDVHTHFMPKPVMDKVWRYFDEAGPLVGRTWPIAYRTDEQDRLKKLRGFGVRAFPSLIYAHKPQMAAWLNEWAATFADETPDCLRTATLYPEPGVETYVRRAVDEGARVISRWAATTPLTRSSTPRGVCSKTPPSQWSSTADPVPPLANTPAPTRSRRCSDAIPDCV